MDLLVRPNVAYNFKFIKSTSLISYFMIVFGIEKADLFHYSLVVVGKLYFPQISECFKFPLIIESYYLSFKNSVKNFLNDLPSVLGPKT